MLPPDIARVATALADSGIGQTAGQISPEALQKLQGLATELNDPKFSAAANRVNEWFLAHPCK